MNLEIITPEKTIYKGEVQSVNVPGSKGPFTILHNHAPIISMLDKGPINFVPNGQSGDLISIAWGVVEVKKNKIIILAELD